MSLLRSAGAVYTPDDFPPLNKFVLTNLPTWHEVICRIITLVSQQVGNRGVSYEEMNFALLIPMPEVNKKHTRMTKHRDLK